MLEKIKAFFSRGRGSSARKAKANNKKRVSLKQRWREMVSEFSKITWLKPKDWAKQTLVVGVFVLALTILVGIIDFVLSNLMRLIAI